MVCPLWLWSTVNYPGIRSNADLFNFHLTHARALRANGREAEADETLKQAYDYVMRVADNLQDESLRRSWLENVRDNREIVAEWQQRMGR